MSLDNILQLDPVDNPKSAGWRPLTEAEFLQRAESMACIDPAKRPGMSVCSQSLWISLFFDGTGNNLKMDQPKSKHSNVARLYLAHDEKNDSTGRYPIYVPGLGTPFPEINEFSADPLGAAFASGGERRLRWAREQFDEVIKKAEARATNPKHRIRMINVALFGFSRGAALARAFAIRLAQECVQQDGRWTYQGYPFRLYFMGLFDTVAAVGLLLPSMEKAVERSPLVAVAALAAALGLVAATPWSLLLVSKLVLAPKKGHRDWADNLKIPEMVEQCVHYVAAHEVRDSFPLDSVRNGEAYPANCQEILYPGVHSDVGGGYAPGEQTRTLADHEKLSQVPLLDMYMAAYAAGVPLQAMSIMRPEIKVMFALCPQTKARFEAYQQRTPGGISLEVDVAYHHYRLYVARASLSGRNDLDAWGRLPKAEQVLMQTGNDNMLAQQKQELKVITEGGQVIKTAGHKATRKKLNERTLTLREATLAFAYDNASCQLMSYSDQQCALDFFDYLVHDSVAGFGVDMSTLDSWRTMYFGDKTHEPQKDQFVMFEAGSY